MQIRANGHRQMQSLCKYGFIAFACGYDRCDTLGEDSYGT
jgi:hypothetical protein